MDTVRPVISWRWLLFTCLGLLAAFTLSAVSAGEARGENQVTTKRAKQVIGIGTSSFSTGIQSASTRVANNSAVRRRAKRPRVWRMTIPTARRATLGVARYFYRNSRPAEFDQTGSIIGDPGWGDYSAGSCKRLTRSRVNCIGMVDKDFDVVDNSGQVIGEDAFYCVWRQSAWYPRAKVKRLKLKLINSGCGWDSED